MALLKPTTAQLMDMLPQWPISRNTLTTGRVDLWRSENVPWTWTAQEFEAQTRMLTASNCGPRDMIAWLIHGVHWVKPLSKNDNIEFNEQLLFWNAHRSYLHAWLDGSQASVEEETLKILCRDLDWHPVWTHFNFPSTLEDFYWAREIRQNTRSVLGSRQPLTSVGSFELAHINADYEFQFSCAVRITKNIRWRTHLPNEPIAVMSSILRSSAFHALPAPFKRSLLVTSAQQGNPKTLHPFLSGEALSVWAHEHSSEEQAWWLKKSRALSFTREQSEQLLEQGIHPLSFVHRSREKDLAVLQAINPDAFRYGYILNGLLSNDTPEPLPLPDLDASDMAF